MKTKKIKAWAVTLKIDDFFIPDFSVEGKFKNVLQIHSKKESANELTRKLNLIAREDDWQTVPCIITYNLPLIKK